MDKMNKTKLRIFLIQNSVSFRNILVAITKEFSSLCDNERERYNGTLKIACVKENKT